MPTALAGITVNRLCGSGLAATLDAARGVKVGEGDLSGGGVESMSRAPLVLSKATSAFDRGQQIADSTLGARFTNPEYAKVYGNDTMPQTADNIAADLGISPGRQRYFLPRPLSQNTRQRARKVSLKTRLFLSRSIRDGKSLQLLSTQMSTLGRPQISKPLQPPCSLRRRR